MHSSSPPATSNSKDLDSSFLATSQCSTPPAIPLISSNLGESAKILSDIDAIPSTIAISTAASVSSTSPRTTKNLNKRDFRGETHLHLCARKGDLALCKKFVEEGADVNVADNAGWTPLHEACAYGFYEMVEFLIKNGADVSNSSSDGVYPLHDAVQSQNPKLVWLLLRNGADSSKRSVRGQLPADLNNGGVKEIDDLLKMATVPDFYPFSEPSISKRHVEEQALKNEEINQAPKIVAPGSFNKLDDQVAETRKSEHYDELLAESSCSRKNDLSRSSPSLLRRELTGIGSACKDNVVEKASAEKKENVVRKSPTKPVLSKNLFLVSDKNRKRTGSSNAALEDSCIGLSNTMTDALENFAASTSSVNDVYEFRSSPESSDSPPALSTTALPGVSSNNLLLQKSNSSTAIPSAPNSLSLLVDTTPNSVQYLGSTVPSAGLIMTTSSFSPLPSSTPVMYSCCVVEVESLSSKVPTNGSSTGANTPPAPKRIKTAALAKELLAAAAASTGPPTTSDTMTNPQNTTNTDKTIETDVCAEMKIEITATEDEMKKLPVACPSTSNSDSDNSPEITEDVEGGSKKVPPLRILLPKTPSSEEDGGDGELHNAESHNAEDNKDDGGESSTCSSKAESPVIIKGADTQLSPSNCGSAASVDVSAVVKKHHHRHHHHHHRQTTDSNDKPTDAQSQRRLTRSRVRQTGAVIVDDASCSSKRKVVNAKQLKDQKSGSNRHEKQKPDDNLLLQSDSDHTKFCTTNTNAETDSSSVHAIGQPKRARVIPITFISEQPEITNGLDIDDECSRHSFDPSVSGDIPTKAAEDDGEDEEDVNGVNEDEAKQKESVASSFFNTTSFNASHQFISAVNERLKRDYIHSMKSTEFIDTSEIEQMCCLNRQIDISSSQRISREINAENEPNIPLPPLLEKLRAEQIKRRNEMRRIHMEERQNKVRELSMRAYIRTHIARPTPTVNAGTSAASNVSAEAAAKMQTVNRFKHLALTTKNRQNMEAQALFVNQEAEWQKAVKKILRQQQKQREEQYENGVRPTFVSECLIDEYNIAIINAMVHKVIVGEEPLPLPNTIIN